MRAKHGQNARRAQVLERLPLTAMDASPKTGRIDMCLIAHQTVVAALGLSLRPASPTSVTLPDLRKLTAGAVDKFFDIRSNRVRGVLTEIHSTSTVVLLASDDRFAGLRARIDHARTIIAGLRRGSGQFKVDRSRVRAIAIMSANVRHHQKGLSNVCL
jgi:hypothetical protein